MKRLKLRRLTASALTLALLAGTLSGCDDIFRPVDPTGDPDETNPYIHWEETEPTTLPTEPTVPEEPGELGYVSGKRVNLRAGPGVNYDSLGMLYFGTEVRILEQRALNGVRWGLTDDGWVCMDYVTLNSGAPVLLGTVTAKMLNIRSGPGQGYDTVGTFKKGDQISILEQETVGSMTWGRTTSGWVSLNYVDITGTVDDVPEDTKPSVSISDTSIIGSWVCMDEGAYFEGREHTCSTWTFRKDGTYVVSTNNSVYTDDLGWRNGDSRTQTGGSFTFDGDTLTLDNESISISIEGDIMEVYGHRTHSLMLRSQDANTLLRELIKRHRAAPDKAIQGSWACILPPRSASVSGELWYFGTDGSFSCSASEYVYDEAASGYRLQTNLVYSGVYFYDGSRLTLCYESVTDSATLETQIGVRCLVRSISISGSTLSLSDDQQLTKNASVKDLVAAIGK